MSASKNEVRRVVSSYLEEPYRPLTGELPAAELAIEGELPEGLSGMYVRNGPNPRLSPKGWYHWFDGDGMVHGVWLRDGRASYRCRYVRTRDFMEEERAGEPLWSGLMNPFDPNAPRGPNKDTANTDLTVHAGKLLATWWLGGEPYRLSLPELETLGPDDFGGTLKGSCASHPKVDPRAGELMFFDFSVAEPPYLTYGVADAQGHVTHSTAIDLPGPRLLHDIAITERYTIFLDLPMVWDQASYRQGKRRVRFERELPTRFGVLARHAAGAEIRWFEVPACYIFHTINAWEVGDEIILYACRVEDPVPKTPTPTATTRARLDILELDPKPHRFRLNLTTGEARQEQLDDVASEFPRIDDQRLGVHTRYSYHPRIANQPTLLFDGLIKYDFEGGTSQVQSFGRNRFVDEAVFVPRPGGTREDDGWLVTFVHDLPENRSELVVLDARHLGDEPVARVRLPQRIPIGFHTTWVPGASGLL